jgi:hypothetical protein
MIPCGISWCVALTDKQFCIVHAKHQHLHPSVIDPEDELNDATNVAYDEGYEDARKYYQDIEGEDE